MLLGTANVDTRELIVSADAVELTGAMLVDAGELDWADEGGTDCDGLLGAGEPERDSELVNEVGTDAVEKTPGSRELNIGTEADCDAEGDSIVRLDDADGLNRADEAETDVELDAADELPCTTGGDCELLVGVSVLETDTLDEGMDEDALLGTPAETREDAAIDVCAVLDSAVDVLPGAVTIELAMADAVAFEGAGASEVPDDSLLNDAMLCEEL